jgi:hypothetical protein
MAGKPKVEIVSHKYLVSKLKLIVEAPRSVSRNITTSYHVDVVGFPLDRGHHSNSRSSSRSLHQGWRQDEDAPSALRCISEIGTK